MATSPFAFYRGAAKVMAIDLAATPTTGITAQICGDGHLSNFGFYGAPDRTLVFDINDFDETLQGPWEWDVKRLAASFSIAARNNDFGADDEMALAREVAAAYRTAIRTFAGMGYLDVWYRRFAADDVLDAFKRDLGKSARKKSKKALERARQRGSRRALSKLTAPSPEGYRIVSQPPLIVPIRDLEATAEPERLHASIVESFRQYVESVPDHLTVLLGRYSFVDLALKVVGVGSVGTRCFVVLLEGRDGSDPLFLQIKEATTSVLETSLPPSPYASAGQRVVEGQQLMQAASDIFLGWTTRSESGHQFYWRQLMDMKRSADVADMDPEQMARYAQLCGWTLARAHARSADATSIAGYLGKADTFDEALSRFARAYADQNDADFAVFKEAIANGDLEAHP